MIVKSLMVQKNDFKQPLCSIEYSLQRCQKISIDGDFGIYSIVCSKEVEDAIKKDIRFEVYDNEYPNLIKTGWNFVKAVANHTANGFQNVSTEEYENRMLICDTCPLRNASRCTQCNCYLPSKAKWKSERCPINKWKSIKEENNDN